MRGKAHRHVALVATEGEAAALHLHAAAVPSSPARGISLLRLSVQGRLLIVVIASALLWGAVFWALA
jgi:hypothetical protein